MTMRRLGDIIIDVATRELRRDNTLVAIEPQVFDLILYLVENADRVVGKPELVDQIWGGRAIADSTLSTSIKFARRALGDTGAAQRMIKTLHRRGFRYVGPYETAKSTAQTSAVVQATPTDLDLTPPDRPSIAVLPLKTMNSHADQEVLAMGLLNDLTQRLSRTRWLFVTARASAAHFRGRTSDPIEVGRALGVRYLLHGSVIRAAGRFRLAISLTNAADGGEVWGETFDRSIDDLFQVQDDISDMVAAAVESQIELKERRMASLRPLASLDAWGSYHRATDLLLRFSRTTHDQAERLFDRASQLDPGSARVFSGLSFLNWQRAFFNKGDARLRHIERAADLARHSIALDPMDAQAHWALGRTSLLLGDLETAADDLSAAVRLNHNYARAHFSLGYAKLFQGDVSDVLVHAAMARRLSPYDPMAFAYLSLFAEAHALRGDSDAAVLWAKRAARQPHAHYHIKAVAAWCCEAAGDHAAAKGFMAEVLKHRPNYSCDEFFQAYPYAGAARETVERWLRVLGL